jgi:hypothetical protein
MPLIPRLGCATCSRTSPIIHYRIEELLPWNVTRNYRSQANQQYRKEGGNERLYRSPLCLCPMADPYILVRSGLLNLNLAPCIAVVGPANAGKTTLLHQLDERLQTRVNAALVLKGNPDGTGRYLFHAPDLREALKSEVKGKWGDATVERICEWIGHGRRNLKIALVDLGGKHTPENDRILRLCSHYILVSRLADAEGAASWDTVCSRNGLERIAWMRSVGPGDSQPAFGTDSDGMLGTFRFDASPGDAINDSVLEPLTNRIAAMVREMASRVGAVILGGADLGLPCRAPVRPAGQYQRTHFLL